MKSTGMVRAVDKMGRVVIPKEIRKQLKVENDVDSFEIYMDGDKVVLKKYQPTCIFCDSLADSVQFEGYNVCKECIEKLYKAGFIKQKDIEKVRDMIYDLLSGWFKSIDYYIKQQIIPIKSCQNKNQ